MSKNFRHFNANWLSFEYPCLASKKIHRVSYEEYKHQYNHYKK